MKKKTLKEALQIINELTDQIDHLTGELGRYRRPSNQEQETLLALIAKTKPYLKQE